MEAPAEKEHDLLHLSFLPPRGFLVSNRVTMRASQMSIECIQIKYDGNRIILILIIDTYLRYILRHREKLGEMKVTFGFFLCFSDLEIFGKSARKGYYGLFGIFQYFIKMNSLFILEI